MALHKLFQSLWFLAVLASLAPEPALQAWTLQGQVAATKGNTALVFVHTFLLTLLHIFSPLHISEGILIETLNFSFIKMLR